MKRIPLAADETITGVMKAVLRGARCWLPMLIAAYAFAPQAFGQSATKVKTASGESADHQPVELGDVHWLRDLDTAVAASKQQEKPIAILFQEVPG